MMREIDPAGTLDRARAQLQVTAVRGSEIIVPRLRGVSHAAAFVLAVAGAVALFKRNVPPALTVMPVVAATRPLPLRRNVPLATVRAPFIVLSVVEVTTFVPE